MSTAENNALWDSAGESARNGRTLTEYVGQHLLDVDNRVSLMDKTGIERVVLSLTSPGIQSITDTATAMTRPAGTLTTRLTRRCGQKSRS